MEEGNFVGDHDYLMMVCVDHDQRRFRLDGVDAIQSDRIWIWVWFWNCITALRYLPYLSASEAGKGWRDASGKLFRTP